MLRDAGLGEAALSEAPDGLIAESGSFAVPAGGVAVSDMPELARSLALALAAEVAGDYRPDLSATVLPPAAVASMRFGWHGDPLPGRPLYWRLAGEGRLIESGRYDDDYSGSPLGHVHRVWRDVGVDFGGVE